VHRIVVRASADGEVHRPIAIGKSNVQRGRIAHVTRSERRPGNAVLTFSEVDHGRRPILGRGTRAPAPTIGFVNPRAVVTGGPAPWLVINPRVTDRIGPNPIAVRIG